MIQHHASTAAVDTCIAMIHAKNTGDGKRNMTGSRQRNGKQDNG